MGDQPDPPAYDGDDDAEVDADNWDEWRMALRSLDPDK